MSRWSRAGLRARQKTEIPRIGLADGHPDVALDDSLGDGVAGKPGDVMDVELAHEMLPMFVHRFEAHAQFPGDLFVGLAFGNQLEHLHLARTQAVCFLLQVRFSIRWLLGASMNAPGYSGAEKCVS